MRTNWTYAGAIAPGGSVSSIVSGPGDAIWLATGAGIFRQGAGGWQAPSGGQPLARPQILLAAAQTVWAAGAEGKLVYTADEGASWYEGYVPQAKPHVGCFAKSPNYGRDRVLLAGTFNSGILRTTDGGRRWHLANTGLHTFVIHDVAAAPVWEGREVLLAATDSGIYRSYNGGRAWKFAALENHVILSLALSPNFAASGIAFAGAQTAGLWRTSDGGKTWQAWAAALADESIAQLWIHPHYPAQPRLLAALEDGRLLRSEDDGQSWKVSAEGDVVLTLQEANGRLFAGFVSGGLATSDDDGDSWQMERTLYAHAVIRLLATPEQRLLAQSLTGQLWSKHASEQNWHELDQPHEHGALQNLAPAPGPFPYWLASTATQLLRTEDEGAHWHAVQSLDEAAAISFSPISPPGHRAWVGTAHGKLYMSKDYGRNWSQVNAPESSSSVLAVAEAIDRSLLAVIYDQRRSELGLWQTPDQGASWSHILNQPSPWPLAHLPVAGRNGQTLAALGSTCWLECDGDWQQVFEAQSQILRLLRLPGHGGLLMALHHALYFSSDGHEWRRLPADQALQDILDVIAFAGPEGAELLVLGRGGKLFRTLIGR